MVIRLSVSMLFLAAGRERNDRDARSLAACCILYEVVGGLGGAGYRIVWLLGVYSARKHVWDVWMGIN